MKLSSCIQVPVSRIEIKHDEAELVAHSNQPSARQIHLNEDSEEFKLTCSAFDGKF